MCLYKYTHYSKQPWAICCTQGPRVDSAPFLGGFVPPCKLKDVKQGGTKTLLLNVSWPQASRAKCINRNGQFYMTTSEKKPNQNKQKITTTQSDENIQVNNT